MSQAPSHPNPNPRQRARCAFVLTLCALTAACDSPKKSHPPTNFRAAYFATALDLATAASERGQLDESLTLAVYTLQQEPSSSKARELVATLLATSRWHLTEFTLPHLMQVDHLQFAAPDTLWVSLSGLSNTLVRWNLASLQIEAVLFPVACPKTRCLVIGPTHQSMVVERGGVVLLCNAQTLRPIRDLDSLPASLTPTSTIAFSPDGLLLAHPELTDNASVTWHLRDASSGEIIRSSEPSHTHDARPLAAVLDRQKLLVLRNDGSLWTMPVSPVEPIEVAPPHEQVTFLHARLADDGSSALLLKNLGPHLAPAQQLVKLCPGDDASLTPERLLENEPWTLQPSLWTGLFRESNSPVKINDTTAQLPFTNTFHAESPITAATFAGDRSFIGCKDGTVTLHRLIPKPKSIRNSSPPTIPDAAALTALENLSEALAGGTLDASTRRLTKTTLNQRLQSFSRCDFNALRRAFPELDFSPVITAFQSFKPKTPTPETSIPLWDRIARADSIGKSWPDLLVISKSLAKTEWHKQLTAAVVARSSQTAVNPEVSPWLAPRQIEKIFEGGDAALIEAAIAGAAEKGAAGKGTAAAKALELALASTHPEWINACLSHATDLPPLLRKIALSRMAWLQNRKADALNGWPDVCPDLTQARLRQDWDGWEQADFTQALETLRLCLSEELSAIDVPPNPSPEQRKSLAEHLSDPTTLLTVGRTRFAKACLKAALAFAAFKDETQTTFLLASRARDLGEEPAPCLRAEAMALTALGDYQKAHARWISLITEHPLKNQQPGDYAEAAYTSFENADPRQAMAILTTGLHRFPNDGNFALRAGWVALLTGNAERAYRFLLTGRQIGYPPEKLENATALLAIAAAQTGATEDATAYYQDLILLDPAWENPDTLESLEWPEDLKASLRQLAR